MLVLSRHEGESIVIHTGREIITVTVAEIRGSNKVRLGVLAPKHVVVVRDEIADRFGVPKHEENAE